MGYRLNVGDATLADGKRPRMSGHAAMAKVQRLRAIT
jgi:hypothetical protein